MIKRPRLKAEQKKALEEMIQCEGWRIVKQMIEGSIDIGNIELINFDWEINEDGSYSRKAIENHKEKRQGISLLKLFLEFINNPLEYKEKESEDIYL